MSRRIELRFWYEQRGAYSKELRESTGQAYAYLAATGKDCRQIALCHYAGKIGLL